MRVLIVEDEALLAMTLEDMVREAGHQVVGVVPDGERAEALALKHAPDVILMDVNIRGERDGVETARRLMDELKSRIVFVTAYADKANQSRMAELKPFAVLSKPYDEIQLNQTLARIAAEL